MTTNTDTVIELLTSELQGVDAGIAKLKQELAELTAKRKQLVQSLAPLGTIGTAALMVGAAALWSSVTAAILERRREIAVMRAIGASNKGLYHVFAFESLLLGGMAVLTSIVIAIPVSALVVSMLGRHALHIDVGLSFSWTAFFIWVGLLAIVMALATAFPLARELRQPPAVSLNYL